MNFERLWAPWRLEYVSGNESDAAAQPEPLDWCPGAERECFLCRAAGRFDDASEADRRLLVADRRDHTLVVLNRYPYNNGHLLVAPRRHVGELNDLSRGEHIECMEQLGRLTGVYRDLLNAEGF